MPYVHTWFLFKMFEMPPVEVSLAKLLLRSREMHQCRLQMAVQMLEGCTCHDW